MAVYSKDFAKPEDEERCKWYDEPVLRPYPYCHFLRKSCLGLDRCPLVYVPEPHGRLIDADRLKESLDFYVLNTRHHYKLTEALVWVRNELLDTAPTVIPANHGQGPDET